MHRVEWITRNISTLLLTIARMITFISQALAIALPNARVTRATFSSSRCRNNVASQIAVDNYALFTDEVNS